MWWAGKCSLGGVTTYQQQIHTLCRGSNHVLIDFQVQGCQRWWCSPSLVWPSTGHCWRTTFGGILRQKLGFSTSLLKCRFPESTPDSVETKLLYWGLRICIFNKLRYWFFFYIYINLFILFIYFWLCWVFVAASGLSLVAVSRGYSSLWCADLPLWCLLLLQSMGSRCTGFSSCGVRAL